MIFFKFNILNVFVDFINEIKMFKTSKVTVNRIQRNPEGTIAFVKKWR